MAKGNSVHPCIGMVALLIALQMAACVSGPTEKNSACEIGKTLVCTEYVGKVDKCTCKSKESLKDILEPR